MIELAVPVMAYGCAVRIHHRQVAVVVGTADEDADAAAPQAGRGYARSPGPPTSVPGPAAAAGRCCRLPSSTARRTRRRTLEVLGIRRGCEPSRCAPPGGSSMNSAQRPSGRSVIASRPSSSAAHISSGVFISPGNRVPRPTMAMFATSSSRLRRPVLVLVDGVQFRLALHDHRRQRLDGRVPECHGGRQRDTGEVPMSLAIATASREERPSSTIGTDSSTESGTARLRSPPSCAAIRASPGPTVRCGLAGFGRGDVRCI